MAPLSFILESIHNPAKPHPTLAPPSAIVGDLYHLRHAEGLPHPFSVLLAPFFFGVGEIPPFFYKPLKATQFKLSEKNEQGGVWLN